MLLVVDSHRESSEIYKTLAQHFKVKLAADGSEAQTMLREIQIQAVVIRYQLSDMKATKLASYIKKINDRLVVFIASEEMSMSVWREVSACKAVFLPMPVQIERIKQLVGKSSVLSSHTAAAISIAKVEEIKVTDCDFPSDSSEEDLQPEIVPLTKIKLPDEDAHLRIKHKKPKIRPPKPVIDHFCHVVMIFSPKGGVGKTTTAVNVAAYTQTQLDLRTIVIEMTRQTGNVLGHFSVNPDVDISHWIQRDTWPQKEELENLMLQCPSTEICIIPTQTLIDEDKNKIKVTPDDVDGMLDTLKPHFDVIIIDAGTVIDEVMYQCMKCSDSILMISKLEWEALQDCHYMPFIMRNRGIDTEKLIFITNQVKSGVGITAEEAIDMVGADRNHIIHYDRNVEKVNKDKKEPHLVRQSKGKYFQEIEQLVAMMIEHPDLPKEDTSILKKMKFWS